ncbi:MAG: type II secretion system protein GspK [Planctomycetes bacterium]|nr:type II secretion system protein GspK [Planctomycetota bacterium]
MKSKKITIPNHTSHISALSRRGVILLAVLIVVSMLALGAYTFSDAMYAEARGTQMFGRSIQAHMLADSGIEFVLALLADPSLTDSTGGTYNNPDLFHQMTVREDPLPRWSGRFSVIASSEEGNLRFGISDESSKLNLNALMDLAPDGDEAALALLALPEMTEETAAAIVDWLDEDSDPRTFGAETGGWAA